MVARATYLDLATVVVGFASDPELDAKQVIFRQGDPADAVFYVETGRVQLTIVSDQGKEGVIALLGPREPRGVLTAVSVEARERPTQMPYWHYRRCSRRIGFGGWVHTRFASAQMRRKGV